MQQFRESLQWNESIVAAYLCRFPHQHYIDMWTKRLVDMGVVVCEAAEANAAEAVAGRRVEAAAVATLDALGAHSVPAAQALDPPLPPAPPVDQVSRSEDDTVTSMLRPYPISAGYPCRCVVRCVAGSSGHAACQSHVVVFGAEESADSRLDKLFAKAMELEHPGIDEEGIETMKQKIADGHFKVEHYMDMWTKRLEKDMGVVVQLGGDTAAAQPEAEPEAEPEAGPEAEAEAEPEAEPNAVEAAVEPEAEAEVQPEAEVNSAPPE